MTRIVYIAGKDLVEETMGGHSSYVRAHARAAIQLGYDPHIFGVGHQTGMIETDFVILHRVRSPYWRISCSEGAGYRTPWNPMHTATAVNAVTEFMRSTPKVSILHSFGWWCYAGVLVRRRLNADGRRVATIAGAYTTTKHESQAKRKQLVFRLDPAKWLFQQIEHSWVLGALSPMERYGLMNSDHVLCNYASVRDLITALGVPTEHIRRIAYTSEQAFFDAQPNNSRYKKSGFGCKEQPPWLVTVSRHDARKGLDVLLHSLAELQRRNIPFRAKILGGGTLLEAHRRLAGALGLASCVEFTGRVDDPYPYLRAADVFVLPSVEEGSGSLSLLEALQAGCAVVATAIDGIPEDVAEGEEALLVHPGSTKDLTEGLQRVLCDETLRRRLGRAARRKFEKDYRPYRFVKELGSVYRSLANNVPDTMMRHPSTAVR